MGIFKNILIPVSAIFILGIFLLFNLLNPTSEIILQPETATRIDEKVTETDQKEIAVIKPIKAPIKSIPVENIKPLPKPVYPKTIENKIPPPIIQTPLIIPPITLPLLTIPTLLPPKISTATPIQPTPPSTSPQTQLQVSSINEDDLMKAVVRIRCGNIFGSGFSVNPKGLVLSVAHVVIDAIEKGAETCDIIFPAKHPSFGFFSEAHYRKGVILSPQETKKLYKEQALDVAILQTSFLPDDPVFPKAFPYINYPFCGPKTLEDKILLFGYAANLGTSPISHGSILSRFEGEILQYEDIIGVKPDYFPESKASADESIQHPITIIFSNNNFSGASGGLVFNISKNCIVGANSAVGTISGDPKVYGFIFNFNFPEVKAWIEPFFN